MMGASQFAGDQFMNASPGQHEGQDVKPMKSGKAETVRNVTVRQVVRDNVNSLSDKNMVDGHELQLMTLCGRITSHVGAGTGAAISFMLDDGTGALEGLQYVNDITPEQMAKVQSDLRVGNYVRVFGVLRNLPDKLSFQSYKTRPVTDYNEITYHNLQVIFQRLQLCAGPPPAAGIGGTGAQAPMQPALGAPMGAAVQGMSDNSGMPALHAQLMDIYNSPDYNSSNGVSMEQVKQLLRPHGNYTAVQVEEAINFLCGEGLIYSTVDDYTHRSCQNM